MDPIGTMGVSDPKSEISVDLELSIGVGPKRASIGSGGAVQKHELRTLRRMEARLRQEEKKRKRLRSVMQAMADEEAAWFANENLNYQDQVAPAANLAAYAMPVIIPYLPAVGRFGLPCVVPCWAPVVAASAVRVEDGVILPMALGDVMPLVDNVGIGSGEAYGSVSAYRAPSAGGSLSGVTEDNGSALQGGGRSSSSSSTKMGSNSTQPEPEPKLGKIPRVPSDQSSSSHTVAPSLPAETKKDSFRAKPALKTLDEIVFAENKPEGEDRGEGSRKKVPVVATKGDGPNGRTVYGYLYRSKKRNNELGIVCACHKRAFSPAEFVKHGGGGETVNPLKRIAVVKPSL